VISYLDTQGKPLGKAARQEQLQEALHAVLAPLGGKMPTRLFYDYNSVQSKPKDVSLRYLPFVSALETVDPDWDLFDTTSSYDLTRILGDLGAGSPFVSVALASMAGLQSGGASLVLVTPPTT